MAVTLFVNHQDSDERRTTMIRDAIGKVALKKDLTGSEMEDVMKEIVTGGPSGEQISSFITALRMKGETSEEIAAAARVLQRMTLNIQAGVDLVCMDREEITVERETILCTATGRTEGPNIFNVSTAAALVAVAGGLNVAKYVRRSVFPFCGCADVIDALGIKLDMTRTQLERCMSELGICFLYESLFGNGLQHITAIREKVGIRTIFNLLDPLINPARAQTQVLGVYEPALTETMATVLKQLDVKRALVVYGEDSLDEISITGRTKVTELKDGEIESQYIRPEDFGFKTGKIAGIKGGTKKQNAEAIIEILDGSRGAKRDITLLNAAAAFVAAGKVKDFREGVELARECIDSGQALNRLERLVEFTHTERRFFRDLYEVEIQ
jgi:anthranilate phosphoribosyltransferase